MIFDLEISQQLVRSLQQHIRLIRAQESWNAEITEEVHTYEHQS